MCRSSGSFPKALLLADMKTMDGGEGEANAVYSGGGNVIDFLASAGEATARAVCAVRDTFRQADPAIPRLAFADVLIPMQGPVGPAVQAAERMLVAGVDRSHDVSPEAFAGKIPAVEALEEGVDGETVVPQPGGFYGGWITSRVVGPFKGVPGSMGW